MNPPGTLSGPFLFVGNGLSNTVSTFKLRLDGIPSPTDDSPVSNGGGLIEGMTIHPSGKWIFVNNEFNIGADTVSSLAVAADGSLTAVSGSPFPLVENPDEVIPHPNGRFLFITNRAKPTVAVLAVDEDGALSHVPGSPFQGPPGFRAHEHCLLDPTSQFLFVTYEIPPGVATYRVGDDGSLTIIPGTPLGLGVPGPGGPEGMAIDPTGRFLYITNHIVDRMHVLRVHSDGTLSAQTDSVPIAGEPFDVIIPGWKVGGKLVMVVATRLRPAPTPSAR